MCDCDDPDCTLPEGRCYLCGVPVPHASNTSGVEFTVGPCCAVRVLALYKQELLALDEDENPEGPPWAPFDGDGETHFCIQRDDEQDFFEGDDAAALHVAKALGIDPAYPDGF